MKYLQIQNFFTHLGIFYYNIMKASKACLPISKNSSSIFFDKMIMNKDFHPIFQQQISWDQLSSAILSRNSDQQIDIQPQIRQRRKQTIIKDDIFIGEGNYSAESGINRRKSAIGECFGFENKKIHHLNLYFPKTFVNQLLLNQIRALHLLNQAHFSKYAKKKKSSKISIIYILEQAISKQYSFGKKIIIKQLDNRFNSAIPEKNKKKRSLFKSQSLFFDDKKQIQESQEQVANNLQPLDSSIINKVNTLNRKLSLKNLLKKKTEALCAVAYWTRLSNQNQRRGTMLNQPSTPLNKSIGSQTPTLQQIRTPNLLQTSLFSNLFKLEGLKQKYLQNQADPEYYWSKDEPDSANIIKSKNIKFEQKSRLNIQKKTNSDYLKSNKKLPQLQKIVSSNKEIEKYIKLKKPLIEQPKLTKSILALDTILKKQVKHQKALNFDNLSIINSSKSHANSQKKRNLSFKSSYSDSSHQILNLINRQKLQIKAINSSINWKKS